VFDNLTTTSGGAARPLLSELRDLLPDRDLSLAELLVLLDQLAGRLRDVTGTVTDVLPIDAISSQPPFRIEDTEVPLSGFSFWDSEARQWVIRLNEDESEPMRRFTVFHEFGHILWHGWENKLFPGLAKINRHRLAEHAADMFAGEALMPKSLVTRLYRGGVHNPVALARHFEVSTNSMRWKLAQMDLPTLVVTRGEYSLRSLNRPRVTLLVDAA
jgi:hypothetical protein